MFAIQLSSIQEDTQALRNVHTRNSPSLRGITTVAFETVLMLFLIDDRLSRPFRKDRRALFCVRFSPLGDGQRGILGSARIQSLQPLHALPSSVVQAACDGCFTRSVSQSVSQSVSLCVCPAVSWTGACPGQYIRRSHRGGYMDSFKSNLETFLFQNL